MQNSLDVLREYFGHDGFREGQQQLIDHILSGRDVLGVMPTGSGKSLCYQIPALILPGITLVVSPLISLMKDQVNALGQQGIKAAFLNSSLSMAQYNRALANARAGAYKIIYVAPERLANAGFMEFAKGAEISLLAVDEAHCVSQWGQDFRPSYLQISDFKEALPNSPVLGAFTATATDRVRDDIVQLLRLDDPYRLVTGFDRGNLHFEVSHTNDKLHSLLAFLADKEGSGIVYCSTRKQVEQVCDGLNEQGFSATRYHAGLQEDERHTNQDDFTYDRKRIIVATNAFGMGIDKSDVRFVVHYNMPGNLENYYQEAGRAGRDGEPAHCLLMYQGKDVETQRYFIENESMENEELSAEQRKELRTRGYELLRIMTGYCHTTDCLRGYILGYFGEEAPDSCGNCGSCDAHFEEKDITIETQKVISCVIRIERMGLSFGKTMIADVLTGKKNQRLLGFGLDKLPTYGIMADMSKAEVVRLIDYLAAQGWLAVNDEKFAVLETTAKSRAVLSGGTIVKMRTRKQPERRVAVRKVAQSNTENIDTSLFEKLRQLRYDIATENNVPAFIIFSDATLKDMCIKQPTNKHQFMLVAGVGSQKCERYAEDFTAAIRSHMLGNH